VRRPARRRGECGFIRSCFFSLRSLRVASVIESTIADGEAPCCDKKKLKKRPWTPEEDKIFMGFITANDNGSWRMLPKLAGLSVFLHQIHQRS
jgi:hypothetical protein